MGTKLISTFAKKTPQVITLNYKQYGETGPAIIILHGLFGMLDNWQTIAKKLDDQYRVFLVDQRNHGRSPHTADFTYPILAEDIRDFITYHEIDNPILIGHSMGGKTVMESLKLFPGSIHKAIVVDIAPKQYKGGHEVLFEALLGIDLTDADSRKEVQVQLAEKVKDQGVLLFLMKNLTRKPEGGYQWKANFASLQENYQHILSTIEFETPVDVETLFIRGEDSGYIQIEDKEVIRANFNKVSIQTVENAGHWVHAQNPTKLLELIHAFLD